MNAPRPTSMTVEVLTMINGAVTPESFNGARVAATVMKSGRARIVVLDDLGRQVLAVLYRRVEKITTTWHY